MYSVKIRNQANEMIISLGMTADLIGEETSSSALVFGLMSLTDKVKLTVNVNMHTRCCSLINIILQLNIFMYTFKVANGLGIVLIQGQVPCVKVRS